VIVSGPSGAGKGTLIEGVLARMPELRVAVSATTRRRRPGEVDGEDYHFLTPEQFESRVAAGDFLEHVEYAGNRYGTLRSEIDASLSRGRSVILEIELAGARSVRGMVAAPLSVFIAPPSIAELERRLERRATDSEDEIARRISSSESVARRIEVSRWELEAAGEFDHVIVNADRDEATDELERILRTAIRGPDRQAPAPGAAGG
jgi:guanylate kinase